MKGVVVCPQPRAADVGAAILSRGGTAFDAAVATAFAQMVADPFMCGMGGMGTLQAYRAADARHAMIDFHTRGGSKVTPGMWAADQTGRSEISGYSFFADNRSELGYTAVMTPGTVRGFAEFHRQYCTMDWADLLAPAIAMAREGVVVTPFYHDFLARKPMAGVPDGFTRITRTPESARVFLNAEGRVHAVGEVLKLPDMANTMERVASGGADEYYTGALAQEIAADLAANGSFITAADLAGYRVREGAPVIGTYRGYQVASNPPPGSGAVLIEMLNILEQFDLGRHPPGGVEHIDLLARALGAAHTDREEWLADPEFADVPVATMISKERAAHWADEIRRGWLPGGRRGSPPSCTTHLSVMDAAGNSVAVTHTLGTGAGVVTPGLGFQWNNAMKLFDPQPGRANSIAPGKARTTGMVPTMLLKDGKPVLVVGAPGGSVIITAVLTTILNIVDFGMSAAEATAFPRIHCEGGPVFAEARIQQSVVDALRARGHEVRHSPHSFDPTMSRAHAVWRGGGSRGAPPSPMGDWQAGADPRGGAGVAWAW
jgi:gamma-glutamyltranspeptidase/glutathione hydrolase